ncbi:MAG: hypothetical protein KGN84_14260, partial [Acidobacteriota bacterium]|nr:hypothetical protein [Acidobacteriota bacterium]
GGAGGESPERGRKAIACDVAAGQPIAPADTVLEVRLKTKDEPKTDVSPVNSAPPVKTEAGKPENVVNTNATASSDKTSSHEKPDSRAAQASNALQPIRSAAEPERAVLSATAQQAASVPAAAGGAQTSSPHAVVAPAENPTPENAVPKAPEVAARTAYIEEPAERPPNAAQPVRSLSLEFTPDGAGDVRLRLSEHTGEVHISLHSTDTTLGSRLHEGVHDLVGSLSSAGYDAEAWTPGRGQQQNRREPEERGNRRSRGSSGSGDASFVDFFSPVQEVS